MNESQRKNLNMIVKKKRINSKPCNHCRTTGKVPLRGYGKKTCFECGGVGRIYYEQEYKVRNKDGGKG